MADLNRVFLMGNLTRDPEVRYTPSGKAVGDLRLAITSRFKNNEDVCYVDVTVWDRQAETCGEYLRKGSPVMVEGRLKFDEWERDGQKRSKLSVVASRVQFMGSPRGAEYRDGSGSRAPPEDGTSVRQTRIVPRRRMSRLLRAQKTTITCLSKRRRLQRHGEITKQQPEGPTLARTRTRTQRAEGGSVPGGGQGY